MITVIIAGGSGTRLWPLSTSDYPKHLLKLIDDTSLLQAAYNRAERAREHVYVVTEQSHAHHVKEQLPELSDDAFLIEPGRRGTDNCIAFALDVIARRHDHDEPIAFVHSDQQFLRLGPFALALPEPRQARRRPQLPRVACWQRATARACCKHAAAWPSSGTACLRSSSP
jgi:mannose-1-phosphate guanylyltransferase